MTPETERLDRAWALVLKLSHTRARLADLEAAVARVDALHQRKEGGRGTQSAEGVEPMVSGSPKGRLEPAIRRWEES